MNIKELLRGKNMLMGVSYSDTVLKLCPALAQFFIIKKQCSGSAAYSDNNWNKCDARDCRGTSSD